VANTGAPFIYPPRRSRLSSATTLRSLFLSRIITLSQQQQHQNHHKKLIVEILGDQIPKSNTTDLSLLLQALLYYSNFLDSKGANLDFQELLVNWFPRELLLDSPRCGVLLAIAAVGTETSGDSSSKIFFIQSALDYLVEKINSWSQISKNSSPVQFETWFNSAWESLFRHQRHNDLSNDCKKIMSRGEGGFLLPQDALNIATVANNLARQLSTPENVVSILRNLGPSCAATASRFRETLREIGAELDEKCLAAILCFLSSQAANVTTEEEISNIIIGMFLPSNRNESEDSDELTSDITSDSPSLPNSASRYPAVNGWNVDAIRNCFAEDFGPPKRNWDDVARFLDNPTFEIKSLGSCLVLLDVYQGVAQRPISQYILLSEWNNAPGQLSLLAAIASSPTEIYPCVLDEFEQIDLCLADGGNANSVWACAMFLDRLLQLSDYTQLYPTVKKIFERGVEQYPFVITCSLCRLYQRQNATSPGAQKRLIMWRDHLLRYTIPLLLQPDSIFSVAAISPAVRQLWSIDRDLVAFWVQNWMGSVQGNPNITAAHRKESVLRMVEIIRRLGRDSLRPILNQDQHIEFSLAVAFAAADQSMISLMEWLTERTSALHVRFLTRLIYVLKDQNPLSVPRGKGSTACLVSEENLLSALKFLENLDPSIQNENLEIMSSTKEPLKVKDGIHGLLLECIQAHPHFRDMLSTTSYISGDEVEEMANSYFQKIYTSENGIDEVIEMLKMFKLSGKRQENEIFACMIHNLFDEYRFFSKYPEKELKITGILFGKLIKEQLISSVTLGIALRYVLEALRKPPTEGLNSPTGKMFRFGMYALEQFKERLHEWPQYCSHIEQISHIKQYYQEMMQEIDETSVTPSHKGVVITEHSSSRVSSVVQAGALSGTVTPLGSAPSSPRDHPRSRTVSEDACLKMLPGSLQHPSEGLTGMEINPSSFTLEQIETASQREAVFGPGLGRAVENEIVDLQAEAPPDITKDRIQFIVNNLSPSNVESKAKELQDVLSPNHFAWFSQILVAKRIQSQLNHHSLYLKLLEILGDYGKGLTEAILENVYWHVGKHLRSPKITTSTSERSLLKNLGSWLGQMTLARNRPILQLTLDCKELLYQGYETGRLIAVTPFVAMILQGAKNSVVFRPPNPWVMGLLGVFRALYDVDALKMNIKFEVEVLCKNLGVKLDDIPARTSDLSNRLAPNKEKNPDFNVKSSSTTILTPAPSGASTPTKNITDLPSTSLSNIVSQPTEAVIPKLSEFVTINPQLYQLAGVDSPPLQRSVQIAVERAIREVIPSMERNVTIACITTKEIVTKDFATEGDESRLRKGGQLMASNLSGSLALVTCRDPLRLSLANHLRTLLMAEFIRNSANGTLSEQEKSTIEQVIASCVADNLDYGCSVIEKTVSDRAARDIDDALAPAMEVRKKHREQTGQPFYDMSIFGNNARYPAALPDLLRPKIGGLRSDELLVYESFNKIPHQPPTAVASNTPTPASGAMPSASSGATSFPTTSTAVPSTVLTSTASNQVPPLSVETLSALATKLNASVIEIFSTHGPRAAEITLNMLPPDHQIRQLLVAIQRYTVGSRAHRPLSPMEQEAVLAFSQSVFKRLYDMSLSEPLRLEVFVALLEVLDECCPQLGKDIGTWATYAPTETDTQRKLHLTILLLLVRSRLIPIGEVDDYLVKNVDHGSNAIWLDFAVLFIRAAVLERIALASDLPKVVGVLTQLVDEGRGLASQQRFLKPISKILEEVKGTYRPVSNMPTSPVDQQRSTSPASVSHVPLASKGIEKTLSLHASSSIASSLVMLSSVSRKTADLVAVAAKGDPPGTRQQVSMLLENWIRLNDEAPGSEKVLAQYLQMLQQSGVGKIEEHTERFFRHSTELIVEATITSAQCIDSRKQTFFSYNLADSYTKLLVLLVRYMNSGGTQEQIALQRISLLNKILGALVRCLMSSYERSKQSNSHWDQRPWLRIMLNLLCDLTAPSPAFDPISLGVITVFGSAFHVIQPLVIPG